jgi:hypothetical protein
MFYAQDTMSNNINVTTGNCYAKHQNNLGVDCFVGNNEAVALEHFRKALAAKSAHEKQILSLSGNSRKSFDGEPINVAVSPFFSVAPAPMSCTNDSHELEGKKAMHCTSLS